MCSISLSGRIYHFQGEYEQKLLDMEGEHTRQIADLEDKHTKELEDCLTGCRDEIAQASNEQKQLVSEIEVSYLIPELKLRLFSLDMHKLKFQCTNISHQRWDDSGIGI